MRNKYMSLYLRHTFTIGDPHELDNLMLHVEYDDGFVAYLNGTEIGRSETMNFTGFPPPFDAEANAGHEVTAKPMIINLKDHFSCSKPAKLKASLLFRSTTQLRTLDLHPELIERKALQEYKMAIRMAFGPFV